MRRAMVRKMISDIRTKLFSGHSRTVALKKNILVSVAFKGLSLVTNFLLVPLCLDYLDKFQYGVWLIIASFLNWFTIFEIGLGAGLKNKLAEALALKNYKRAKLFVSTAFTSIAAIMLLVSTLFFAIQPFIQWHKVFNVDAAMEPELRRVVQIAFSFFFFQFVFRLINSVLYADQKAGLSNAVGPVSSVLSLLVIFIISRTVDSSLLYLTVALCGSQLLIIVLANVYFFNTRFKHIKPSLLYFRRSALKGLLGLGLKFFVIQISAIFMLQATNIVIAQFYSPNEVTQFEITKRLFSVSFILFQIITKPLWPAYTQAWVKGELDWVRGTTKKLVKLWALVALGTVVVLAFSPFIYKIWLNGKVEIPFMLSALVALHFLLFLFGNIFNTFINGVGKLKVQLYSLLLGAVIYLPLTWLFKMKLGMGVEGVIVAMIIADFYSFIIAPIQFNKILNGKAKGIWFS